MKKDIQYKGLNTYISSHKNFKFGNALIIFMCITLICLMIFSKVFITPKEEVNTVVSDIENKEVEEEKNIEVEKDIVSGVVSTSYLDEEKMTFLQTIAQEAIRTHEKYGILPSITIAQAILESGWGQSELAITHNNLFGIKADSRWSGAVATIATSENYNDSTIANFRKYDNIMESIEDHGKFLYENSRYAEYGLFNGKDYKEQAQALEDAGYSTVQNESGVPIYADKLISLIEKYNLMQYD